ncbi:outer membrane beta-barrel family protein [Pedobacter cryoconitis]|uniref:Outer membrane receptor protein involved in Fe transport n=1 Tax=Pedobacter cryoconitis TaxID=188932 RepID=A0A327SWK7_9SPHI|nr:outer membrane beta-barrel family protein [Pedobacter cryoconitis]RAJ32154.1 outer membrane receptor protein involved in Fe transport [Pedobacter cryoconitis]
MIDANFKQNILLIFLLTCVFSNGFAQSNTKLILKGILKNLDNVAIDGATLFLKDGHTGQVIKQSLTSADGAFTLTTDSGSYVVAASYLGALSYQSQLLQLSENMDLGVIKIEVITRSLKEIVIQSSANKPLVKIEGRKMIYNIQQSITAQGTNVLEALKKTPGVIVNQDNSITLNGANGALVMINGRQTYLQAAELAQLLKTMSSSDLKSIEVIRNPSSEYDAAGTGGIINLVLQKSIAEGFNGSINNGVAYGVTLKQNTNMNLNFRKGKVNLFGSYNHNFGHFAMDYDNDRTTNGKVYLNANHDVDKRRNIGSALGADYAIDTTKTIGIVMNGNFSSGGGLITPLTNIYDQPTGQLLQTLKSQSDYPDQKTNRYNVNLNYRYKGRKNNILDIDADYGIFDAATKNLSTNSFYAPNGDFQSANNFLVANSRDIKLYAVKADYGFSLGKGRMVTGAKFSTVNADNVFNQYDMNSSVAIIDVDVSNTFKYQEQITAGYLKYETPVNEELQVDIGVRMENTHSKGDLQPRNGSNQSPVLVVRNYLNVFPTAGITYKTKNSGTYNLSVARRIDRPAYNDLNPFSYPVDELSYWKGNPFLQPQYANTLALQYSYKNTTISAGYTKTSDLSSGITEVLEQNRIIMIPRNIGFQNNLNLTITQQITLAKWWTMSLTGIGYRLENKVGTPEYGNYSRSRFAGTFNIQQTFNLPGHMTAEVAGVVNSKNISGLNTYIKSNSQVDLGLQKNLMKDKATLKLAVTDLFRTNKINTDTQLNNLLLHTTYVGESRQIRLNFTYRFGNKKIKSKDNRESGLQNESQRL